MGLASLLRAAEADEGLAAGFRMTKAGADAVFGMKGNVAFDFRGEVGFRAVGAEESAKALGECSELAHRDSLRLFCRREKAGKDGGGLFPFGGGFLQLALAGLG
jgi:hypothetical protein